jgi:hypothetical protein
LIFETVANEWLISCKRLLEDLRSAVAAGRPGCGRRPASPAFVGCISGLGATAAGSAARGTRLRATLADDSRQRSQGAVDGSSIRKYRSHIRL